jgi:mRNA interferase YafQ
MKLASTTHFDKKLSRKIKGNIILKKKVSLRLKLLAVDIGNPILKTHKLKGKRSEEYAITIEGNLRIIFQIIKDMILLTDVINHDEY